MLLEITKAFAGPVATVLAVFLVSVLGLRAFRAQKALERRLEWYERAYALLDETAEFYSQWPSYAESQSPEAKARLDESMKAANALRDHLGRSWLYADQDAHEAVESLRDNIHEAHERMLQSGHVLPAEVKRIIVSCTITSLRLSIGIRKQLALPPLKPTSTKAAG